MRCRDARNSATALRRRVTVEHATSPSSRFTRQLSCGSDTSRYRAGGKFVSINGAIEEMASPPEPMEMDQ